MAFRPFAALLAGAALLATIPVSADTIPNLLANPGFETLADRSPVGWTYTGPDSLRAATLDPHGGRDSTRGIRFTVIATPRAWESDPVVVRGGDTYRLEWWQIAEMSAHSSFGGVRVRFFDLAGDPCGTYERRSRTRGTYGWVRGWVRFDAPPEAKKAVVELFGEAIRRTPGEVYLDDVALYAIADRRAPDGWGVLRGAVRVGDAAGPGWARVTITGSDGKRHAPLESYPFVDTTFHALGEPFDIALPPGRAIVSIVRGFEYAPWRDTVDIRAGRTTEIAPRLVRNLPVDGWFGGDAHVHFVGHRSTIHPQMRPETVMEIARAEGVHWTSFKNGSVPDFVSRGTDRLAPDCIVEMGVEATSDFHGHFYTVNVREMPPRWRFPGGETPFPMAYDAWDALIPRGVMFAHAHPFGRFGWDSTLADIANPENLVASREWPLDIALGQQPALDVLCNDGGHGSSIALRDYYRALNCGFRFPVSASTDAYVDQGRMRPGASRLYVKTDSLAWDAVAAAFRKGASFATNGPLVWFAVNGASPGDEVPLRRGGSVEVNVRAASQWGLIRAEIIRNGEVVRTIRPGPDGEIRDRATIDMPRSGWIALRVFGPKSADLNIERLISPEWQEEGIGQFAHTSPVWVVVDGRPVRPDPSAARYFVGWMDAYKTAFESDPDLFDRMDATQQDEVRRKVLDRIARARAVYERMAAGRPLTP